MRFSYGLLGNADQEKVSEVENFALQQLGCVARTMRLCAALLKDKTVVCDVFNSS